MRGHAHQFCRARCRDLTLSLFVVVLINALAIGTDHVCQNGLAMCRTSLMHSTIVCERPHHTVQQA